MKGPKHYSEIYEKLLADPPQDSDGNRRRGNACFDEFWRGFDGFPTHAENTSPGRSAWLAGKHRAVIEKQAEK